MALADEENKLAIEIIATLVNIKNTMAKLILEPSGVPQNIYLPLLSKRDNITGKPLSKRQIAPLILDSLEKNGICFQVVRRMIGIAASWNKLYLAEKEYAAGATVQKAKELLEAIEAKEENQAKDIQLDKEKELQQIEQERIRAFSNQCAALLSMFDSLSTSNDEQVRGFHLQELLTRTFDLHSIQVVGSFKRNEGGEQIDGAFKLEGWHYIVECRWRKQLSNIRDLDGLLGQIQRSGRQTMGLFLSITGWSENVPPLLKQNTDKSIILMEGYDLRTVLDAQLNLRDFMLAKIAKLNLKGEPFLSIKEYLSKLQNESTTHR